MSKTFTRVRVVLGEKANAVRELIFESDGRRETSVFRYDAEWLEHPDRFAIAPSMPLSDSPFYQGAMRENRRAALPGALSDSAPDSWGRGLIRRASSRPLTELSELSGNKASIEAALEAAPFFEIDRDVARTMLGDMIRVVDGRWRIECRKSGMNPREIASYTPAFDHEEFRQAVQIS
ncbi:MAG: HipA N-terminal domain-containing protein [Gammaproteobacteria bacterium]|nr:HipA N-terminal domain-containing protein [Gammaproteobacteria bacterium]